MTRTAAAPADHDDPLAEIGQARVGPGLTPHAASGPQARQVRPIRPEPAPATTDEGWDGADPDLDADVDFGAEPAFESGGARRTNAALMPEPAPRKAAPVLAGPAARAARPVQRSRHAAGDDRAAGARPVRRMGRPVLVGGGGGGACHREVPPSGSTPARVERCAVIRGPP